MHESTVSWTYPSDTSSKINQPIKLNCIWGFPPPPPTGTSYTLLPPLTSVYPPHICSSFPLETRMWPSGEWVKQILSHVPPTDPHFQLHSDINPYIALQPTQPLYPPVPPPIWGRPMVTVRLVSKQSCLTYHQRPSSIIARVSATCRPKSNLSLKRPLLGRLKQAPSTDYQYNY